MAVDSQPVGRAGVWLGSSPFLRRATRSGHVKDDRIRASTRAAPGLSARIAGIDRLVAISDAYIHRTLTISRPRSSRILALRCCPPACGCCRFRLPRFIHFLRASRVDFGTLLAEAGGYRTVVRATVAATEESGGGIDPAYGSLAGAGVVGYPVLQENCGYRCPGRTSRVAGLALVGCGNISLDK